MSSIQVQFTEGAERQFGIATLNMLLRDLSCAFLPVPVCLLDSISRSSEQSELQECIASLSQLLKRLHTMQKKNGRSIAITMLEGDHHQYSPCPHNYDVVDWSRKTLF